MGDKFGDLALPVTGAIMGRIASTAATFPLENLATLRQDAKSTTSTGAKLTGSSLISKLTKGVPSMMGYEISLSAVWWFSYHNTFLYLN